MIGYLLAALVGMLGWGALQAARMGGLTALLNNFKTNTKINNLDGQISKDQGSEQVQTQVRDYIQEHLDKTENSKQGDELEDLRNFFNDTSGGDHK